MIPTEMADLSSVSFCSPSATRQGAVHLAIAGLQIHVLVRVAGGSNHGQLGKIRNLGMGHSAPVKPEWDHVRPSNANGTTPGHRPILFCSRNLRQRLRTGLLPPSEAILPFELAWRPSPCEARQEAPWHRTRARSRAWPACHLTTRISNT